MDNLSQIYDSTFFAQWGRSNSTYVNSAETITRILYDTLRPSSLVDIGCGSGAYAHFFKQKNVRVLCIDGVLPPEHERYPEQIELLDLTLPFKNRWGRFDIALCLEVAEHIPEKLTDTFLDNITQFSDTLILSCAPPGQGGHHHVNEQPKRYWIEKLKGKKFIYDRKTTGQLVETFKSQQPRIPYGWMYQQISVYRKHTSRK